MSSGTKGSREASIYRGRQHSIFLGAATGMRAKCPIVLAILGVSVLTWSAQAASPPQPGHPATWRPYDLIVDLHDLPQRYSCDDLWYKFHDVLLAIGARADLKIVTYRCERSQSESNARSPRAQLQFALPELLSPAQSRWAQLQATTTTVRLAPGQPKSLQSTDCELLQQMKDGLLASLSQRIVSFDLACAAPHPARWPFHVTVQTLTPAPTVPGVVAQAGDIPRRN
jgi:hypothetical protein